MTLEEKIKRFPVICMTRVCGWLVDKKAGNPGKQSEYSDRVNFKINDRPKTSK